MMLLRPDVGHGVGAVVVGDVFTGDAAAVVRAAVVGHGVVVAVVGLRSVVGA